MEKLSINSQDVKFENGVYKYFSCTCDKTDLEFWKKVCFLLTGSQEEQSSSLIYTLSHCFDGVVIGLWADMWMGFKVEAKSKQYYITTDRLDYGLACAISILLLQHPEELAEIDSLTELYNFLLENP